MKHSVRIALIMILSLFVSQNAYAVQRPKPLATDPRIRTYFYSPNEVYVWVGHYRYASIIEFEKGEKILTVLMGDSTAWKPEVQQHKLFIKPVDQDATTNMTVITDKRTYQFELYAEEAKDIKDEDLVFQAKFIYNTGQNENVRSYQSDKPPTAAEANKKIMPDLSKPENYNMNYTISGSEGNAPIKVFDDGEFTFFQFRNKNAEIPGFFTVAADGSESLVNYRIIGDYVVVERVTSQFTLRNGNDIICVYNEANPLQPIVREQYVPKKRRE